MAEHGMLRRGKEGGRHGQKAGRTAVQVRCGRQEGEAGKAWWWGRVA